MGKWKSFIIACLGLGVAIAAGVGFYIYNSISSEESSNTIKCGGEKTHATNEDLCDAPNDDKSTGPLAKIQDFCHAANHKPVDLQRDKQTEEPTEGQDFNNAGHEDKETVSLISEIKLKCSENEDHNNESTSADNGTESLTESKDLNSNENDRAVDLPSETQADPQVEKEHLNNTSTDKIPVDLTKDTPLKTQVNVQDLNDSGGNERALTSEALVTIVTTASRSPRKGEGYHRGQYWIPC